MTVPQLYSIWVEHLKGVSPITWWAYLVASLIWLFYGLKHRDMPIITVEAVWIILEVLIILGIAQL